MIRPLRQRHRRAVLALGIFLPVAFAVGITARKPAPEVDSLPQELASPATQFASQKWQRADLFPKSPVQICLMREHGETGKFAIKLSAPKDFIRPDMIVYWVSGSAAITDAVPASAILLGSFSSAALPFPDEFTKANGRIVLFSLADNEIVDVSRAMGFSDSLE
jgi:hypothetical protein